MSNDITCGGGPSHCGNCGAWPAHQTPRGLRCNSCDDRDYAAEHPVPLPPHYPEIPKPNKLEMSDLTDEEMRASLRSRHPPEASADPKLSAQSQPGAPVWIVFQYRESGEPEFQGVFSSAEKAVAECRTDRYCVCPAVIDAQVPHETQPHWNGAWYPKGSHSQEPNIQAVLDAISGPARHPVPPTGEHEVIRDISKILST